MMMPKVKVRRRVDSVTVEKHITLMERWQEVSKLLNGDAPAVKEHRAKLFGEDAGIETSDLFSEIALCKRDGMPNYHEFKRLSIRDRAKYLAFSTLDAIKETIERHESILEENKKRELSRHKKKK